MKKKSKCEIILEYMANHNGKATIWEIQNKDVACTTAPHKFMQYLKQKGLITSVKAESGNYHIYTLVNKQLNLGIPNV